MLIRENPGRAEAIIRAVADRPRRARTPGVHVSELIQCLRKSWYARHGTEKVDDPDLDLIFLIGETHQTILDRGVGGQTEALCQIPSPYGAIEGTIDNFRPNQRPSVSEVKSTRRLADKAPQDTMPAYIEQTASYCLAVGRLMAELVILHIQDIPPVLKVWDITFTTEELEGWRLELVRRQAVLLGEDVPDLSEHRRGECELCPYRKRKGGKGVCPGSEGRQAVGWFYPSNPPGWMTN